MRQNNQHSNFIKLLIKAQKYCAYQERCEQEVIEKLINLGANKSTVEEILKTLKADDFLNNERFLESYIRGKTNIKKWGKYKVYQGLKAKRFNEKEINQAVEKYSSAEVFKNNAKYLAEKKLKELKKDSLINKKEKIYRFLIQKGYESSLVFEVINELIP